MTMRPSVANRERVAIVVALEALEDGDQRFAVDVLLEALEGDGHVELRYRCACGSAFEWPGQLAAHEDRAGHGSEWAEAA